MDQTESTHFQDFHLHGIRSDRIQKEGLSSGLSNTFLLIDLLILIPVCYLHYMIKRMFKREKGQKRTYPDQKAIELLFKYCSCDVYLFFRVRPFNLAI